MPTLKGLYNEGFEFFDIVAGTGIGVVPTAMVTATDAFGRLLYTTPSPGAVGGDGGAEVWALGQGSGESWVVSAAG